MALTIEEYVGDTKALNAGPLTATTGTATDIGDELWVFGTTDGSTDIQTAPTAISGVTWTNIGYIQSNTTSDSNIQVYLGSVSTAGAKTVTMTNTSANAALHVFRIRGSGGIDGVLTNAKNATTSTSMPWPSYTVNNNNSLVIMVGSEERGSGTAPTIPAPTGFTKPTGADRIINDGGSTICYLFANITATTTPAATTVSASETSMCSGAVVIKSSPATPGNFFPFVGAIPQ